MFRTMRAAIAGAVILISAAARSEPVTITFLHTNDIYEIGPKEPGGGFAPLMTLLKRERAGAAHSLTTFGGDLFSPSILSSITKGAHMVELMNVIGLEAAAIGNHEFDHGPEIAAQRIAESRFPWLGANVKTAAGAQAAGTVPTLLIERGSCKVGLFGVLAEETEVLSNVGRDIRIGNFVDAAAEAVRALKQQGADIVVGLTHLTFADDRRLARAVPGLHLILGGHDHDPITFVENGVLIHKSGQDAVHLGAIDLTADCLAARGQQSLKPAFAWRMLATKGVPPDPEIQALVDKYEETLAAELDVPVGTTSVEIDGRRAVLRTRESALGNLFADALRARTGGEIALINGGGLRGNKIYPAGAQMTRRDILAEMPFGNVGVLIEVTGEQLLAALENGLSEIEREAGRFPQVSGIAVTYDPSRPRGSRIVRATISGAPVGRGRTYSLATLDYLANGGDGYTMLRDAKTVIDASGGGLAATAVADYIQAAKTIAPRVEGRLRPNR